MNQKPIIFALANPTPEIMPDEAFEGGAFIYGSGRSDFPNQINNSLVFPGIFKGLKDNRVLKEVTMDMKLKASIAISKCLGSAPKTDYIIPASLDKHIPEIVSKAIVG